MRPLLILGLALLAAACADERKFYRSGATQADYRKDTYQCERDARSVAASFGGGITAGMEAKAFMVRCMQHHGWDYR